MTTRKTCSSFCTHSHEFKINQPGLRKRARVISSSNEDENDLFFPFRDSDFSDTTEFDSEDSLDLHPVKPPVIQPTVNVPPKRVTHYWTQTSTLALIDLCSRVQVERSVNESDRERRWKMVSQMLVERGYKNITLEQVKTKWHREKLAYDKHLNYVPTGNRRVPPVYKFAKEMQNALKHVEESKLLLASIKPMPQSIRTSSKTTDYANEKENTAPKQPLNRNSTGVKLPASESLATREAENVSMKQFNKGQSTNPDHLQEKRQRIESVNENVTNAVQPFKKPLEPARSTDRKLALKEKMHNEKMEYRNRKLILMEKAVGLLEKLVSAPRW